MNDRIRDYLKNLQQIELTPAILVENLRPIGDRHQTLPTTIPANSVRLHSKRASAATSTQLILGYIRKRKPTAINGVRPALLPPLEPNEYATEPADTDVTPAALQGGKAAKPSVRAKSSAYRYNQGLAAELLTEPLGEQGVNIAGRDYGTLMKKQNDKTR